jgi:hypothetical protein
MRLRRFAFAPKFLYTWVTFQGRRVVVNAQLVEQLSLNEQEAVESFLTRLWTQHSERIFQATLFGSKARGDSQPDSDIDILLIVDEDDWRFRHAISDIASGVSLEYSVLIAPRVIGQARWTEMEQECFTLCENVAREGIPLGFEAAQSLAEEEQTTAPA